LHTGPSGSGIAISAQNASDHGTRGVLRLKAWHGTGNQKDQKNL
jgi:hypothetical protein